MWCVVGGCWTPNFHPGIVRSPSYCALLWIHIANSKVNQPIPDSQAGGPTKRLCEA